MLASCSKCIPKLCGFYRRSAFCERESESERVRHHSRQTVQWLRILVDRAFDYWAPRCWPVALESDSKSEHSKLPNLQPPDRSSTRSVLLINKCVNNFWNKKKRSDLVNLICRPFGNVGGIRARRAAEFGCTVIDHCPHRCRPLPRQCVLFHQTMLAKSLEARSNELSTATKNQSAQSACPRPPLSWSPK